MITILEKLVGDVIYIGDDITITILGVKGRTARIGVNAPSRTEVRSREDLYRERKHRKMLK